MIVKYSDFKHSLNENVAQAKTYLKNKALKNKRAETNDSLVNLTPYEAKGAENDRDFLKIKDMLKDNPGYTYAFTKFFFEDMVDTEISQRHIELKSLYDTLKDMRQSLSQLPLPSIEAYTKQKPTNDDQRKPYERLIDDIEKLKTGRLSNKWINKLFSWQKVWFDNMTPAQKEKIEGISTAFDEFGKEPDGTIDLQKNKQLQNFFFAGVGRHKTMSELLSAAIDNIKAANNAGTVKFLQAVERVNKKYGEINGAEEVYNKNGILIIEVKTFTANRDLNANTKHCIASTLSNWNHYCGDNYFNKQYYIYDFDLLPSDNKSVIGVTIDDKGKITACHLKNDDNFINGIKAYLEEKNIPISVLAPMTEEEVDKKKKRIEANKKIITPNITIEELKKCFEDGGDPNAQTGRPLQNSVKDDDYDRTKYLLDIGANPNIGECIKFSKNLKMIKLLVEYNAEMDGEVFDSIINDYEGVEYILKSGVNPNFDNGYPLRKASALGNVEIISLLINHGAKISERKYLVVKSASSNYKLDILKLLFDKMKQMKDPALNDKELINSWIFWCENSQITDSNNLKEKTLEFLKNQL
jgi:hypothetical protein